MVEIYKKNILQTGFSIILQIFEVLIFSIKYCIIKHITVFRKALHLKRLFYDSHSPNSERSFVNVIFFLQYYDSHVHSKGP